MMGTQFLKISKGDGMKNTLMGEGFILLTRGYGFMGGVYHPPFDTLKNVLLLMI